MVAAGSDPLSPEDLTERLRAGGTLPTGHVIAVHPGQARQTLTSTIAAYRVEYSPDAPPQPPTRLILKGSGSGIDPLLRRSTEQEAGFYRQAAPLTPAGLVPRCYDAQVTEAGIRLLLEDLSDTHMIVTVWPVPPTIEVCERIVDTWAAFHAFWWQHPQLGRVLDTLDRRITPALLRQHCTISTATPTCGTCCIHETVARGACASSTGRTGGWAAASATSPT